MLTKSMKYIALLVFYCCFQFTALGQSQPKEVAESAIAMQIQQYYNMEEAELPLEEVVTLATNVIQQGEAYSQNTLAMTYSLLADVADIRGEASRSFQFAMFGLTYKPIAAEVALNLKLRKASGYFFKGQYQNLIKLMEEVMLLAERENNLKYQVLSRAYRAMARAIIGDYENSLRDLLAVETLIGHKQEAVDFIQLYELLAISQHYLTNDEVALNLYEKVLAQRFEREQLIGIETTYVNLADVYLNMGRLDDAFSAFWEAKNYAEKFELPIKMAYAELGIGKVYLRQGNNEQAFKSLVEAESLFKGQNLSNAYLSTLTELIIASQRTGREQFAKELIMRAQGLAEVSELNQAQGPLYQLLAEYYEQQQDSIQALTMLKRYVAVKDKHTSREKISAAKAGAHFNPTEHSQLQALKVVEISETQPASISSVQQKKQNTVLLWISFLLLVIVMYQWFKLRTQRMRFLYDQVEKPAYILSRPPETKQLYQRIFKKARKYEYPLTVGYIEIKNWQDLSFQFNKRVVQEVEKTIATIINQNIGEFDYAGQINQGEYLLMFPHQPTEIVAPKLDKLIDALKVRFFANLGDFSVTIGYSHNQQTAQDIDPYIFLSRLSDT